MSTTGKTIIPRERIDLAEKLYLAGWPRQRIARRLCKDFGVAARTARGYIERAEKRIAALPKSSPEVAFQRVESMLLETYRVARTGVHRLVVSQGQGTPSRVEAFPEANVGVMATVAVRLAELHGIAGAHKIDLTSGGKPLASHTDDELRERLAALEAATPGADPALPH